MKKVLGNKNIENQNNAKFEQALNKIDETISQLQTALFEKECNKIIDESYHELATQMYKAIEQRAAIKRSLQKQ